MGVWVNCAATGGLKAPTIPHACKCTSRLTWKETWYSGCARPFALFRAFLNINYLLPNLFSSWWKNQMTGDHNLFSVCMAGVARTQKFKGSNWIFPDPLGTAKPKFKGSEVLNVAHLKKISWFSVSLFVHFQVFCINNDNFWCEQLGKGFRHSTSSKI